ncbi:MAG: lipopolysaccharide biosynthesis protein [Nitrococcus sp.]|nr:lipopolysaccharide biosynthesis protein [Nitrococcus sp.]
MRVASQEHFSTTHLTADLGGRSVRGGTVMIAAQGVKFILQLGSLMVLARLLTPADFGLVAMVTAITGFAVMFKDAGLSMATVQRAEINHAQVSTLFWINVGLSIVFMGLTAALAPTIAWFYGKPELTWIALSLAGTFIFGGLTIQHQALLRRQMRFTALAITSVASMASGIAAAVTAAVLGAGYWALVLMPATSAVTNTILVWLLCHWRPGLPRRGTDIRSMLAFGGNLTCCNFLNYLTRNADKMLVGWAWGAGPVGLYTKAYSLLMLPIHQINAPISGVVIPSLSRLKDDAERYRAYYMKAILLMTAVGMPLTAFALTAADDLVLAIFGEQWIEAVPIFRALAPAAFLGTFNVAAGWVYASQGRADRQLRWGVIATPANIVAFLVGLPFGAIGVAIAFSSAQAILRLPALVYCFKGTPLRLADVGSVIWRPTLASISAAAGLLLFEGLGVYPGHIALDIGRQAGIFGCCYLVAWLALPGGARHISDTFHLIRMARPGLLSEPRLL